MRTISSITIDIHGSFTACNWHFTFMQNDVASFIFSLSRYSEACFTFYIISCLSNCSNSQLDHPWPCVLWHVDHVINEPCNRQSTKYRRCSCRISMFRMKCSRLEPTGSRPCFMHATGLAVSITPNKVDEKWGKRMSLQIERLKVL